MIELTSVADDGASLEVDLLEGLAREGELMAFPHHGFWHPMDTLRDRTFLEEQWQSGNAKWRVW